jgi:predicted lipoprotein with Yx(FWY)xxD motif
MTPSCLVLRTTRRPVATEPIVVPARAGDVGNGKFRSRSLEGSHIVRRTIRGAAVALGVLVLAGCGSSTYGGSSSGSSSSSSGGTADAVLGTASTDLGTVVVAADGHTVYVFDKDTAGSGSSACSGTCAANWPAVTADSAEPAVDGVTGDVGTITRDDGTMQVTLDGMPLYTYAGDSDAGAVTGEGVQGVWWAVAADGTKVTVAPSSAPAPGGY